MILSFFFISLFLFHFPTKICTQFLSVNNKRNWTETLTQCVEWSQFDRLLFSAIWPTSLWVLCHQTFLVTTTNVLQQQAIHNSVAVGANRWRLFALWIPASSTQTEFFVIETPESIVTTTAAVITDYYVTKIDSASIERKINRDEHCGSKCKELVVLLARRVVGYHLKTRKHTNAIDRRLLLFMQIQCSHARRVNKFRLQRRVRRCWVFWRHPQFYLPQWQLFQIAAVRRVRRHTGLTHHF